jgi:hypothetical protein
MTMLLVAPLAAAEEATLAHLLPAETVLYLETRNPTPEEAERMAATRCLKEPALKKVLDRLMSSGSSFSSMRTPVGPAALAVTVDVGKSYAEIRYFDASGERRVQVKDRMSLAWIGWQEGAIPVDAVVGLEVGGEPDEALETLKRLLAALLLEIKGQPAGSIDDEIEQSIQDGTEKGVRRIRASVRGFELHFAMIDGMLVGATSAARISDMLERAAGRTTGSLVQTDDYKRVLAATGGESTATTVFLLRADRVVETLQAPFPQVTAYVRGMLYGLGLQGLRGLESVTWVDGEGVSARTSVVISDHTRGLGRLFAPGEPASLELLSFAPEETLYVTAGKLDAGELWKIALEVGGLPVGMAEQEFQKFFGVELKRELLDRIGPEAAFLVSRTNGLVPDVGLVIESEEPRKLEETLVRMLDRVPWPAGSGLQSFTVGEVTAHVAALGHPRLAEVPIAPTFGVVDGKLLIALYPISFQRFLAVARGERPSLSDNRDFAALRKRVPAGVEALSYLDLPALVAFGYDTLVPVLQSMPNQNQVSSLYGLPDAELLTRHLYGRIGWRVADESGMHWYSHAAVDTTGFALGLLGAAGGLMTALVMTPEVEAMEVDAKAPTDPAIPVARPSDKDLQVMEDRDRIRLLRARVQLYRVKHDGDLPPDLDALRAEHVDADTFVSAGSDRPFVYLGPAGQGGVLIHGHPNGPDGKVHVLIADGFVIDRISPAELAKRLGR